jgi:SAM-dependent methyltransferase
MYGIEEIYDIIHQDKNYLNESKIVSKIIDQNINESEIDLLDVACGSGSHLFYLKDKYKCIGIDINKKLIEITKKKQIEAYCFDMKEFTLNKKFNVITCLFGSIAHLKNYKELCCAMSNFKHHLKENGVVILEPWVFLNQYTPRTASRHISDSIWVESKNTIKGNVAILDKTYKLKEEEKEIEYKCHFEICCFTKEEYISAAENSGFKVFEINQQLETDFSNGIFLLK